MKRYLLFVLTLALLSCDNEIDDKVNDYRNKPKSESLKGFWQLKGLYNKEATSPEEPIYITNGGLAKIAEGEMLHLDNEYMRFLNKDDEGTFYSSSDRRFYWFNENNFIRSMYQFDYGKGINEIAEFQLPYRFGENQDTLIVQSNRKILYLLRTENVNYTEI